MLASISWLRELAPVPDDPARVAEALTSRGLTVDAVTPADADTILDIDVPANRPDCLGHLGLARELCSAFAVPLRARSREEEITAGTPIEAAVQVRVDDPELCPRYTARLVRGVRIGESPEWVRNRLERCGLRSINNVVDASNLVLLELGHPIHTFDLARIEGACVVIRRAGAREKLTTLDGIERELAASTLVIADAQRPVAIAGVIGGADSEIGVETRDVLIEAAYFEPRSIRATAKRLGVTTDASQRFGRGADPEGVVAAQDLAVRLIVQLAGGRAAPGMLDSRTAPSAPRLAHVRLARVARLLGFDPGLEAARSALASLGLAPVEADPGTLQVTVPSWRVDLEREEDLVEEIARHLGYGLIPSFQGAGSLRPEEDPGMAAEEHCRDLMASAGFHEAFSYAMIGALEDAPFVAAEALPPLRLANPIAETLSQLRRSLLPGLVRSVDLNERRGNSDVRLFEVGKVFLSPAAPGFPEEPLRVGFAWSGAAEPRHWSRPPRGVTLSDAAGLVESLINAVRPGVTYGRRRARIAGFHPGRSIEWTTADGDAVAWCGALHPDLGDRLGLAGTPYLAEIEIGRLLAQAARATVYEPLSRFPSVLRDLALVLADGATFGSVHEVLSDVEAPSPVRFEVIDRYEGDPLPVGAVSLTVRAVLDPRERTLTEAEIEGYRRRLIAALDSLPGVTLRA